MTILPVVIDLRLFINIFNHTPSGTMDKSIQKRHILSKYYIYILLVVSLYIGSQSTSHALNVCISDTNTKLSRVARKSVETSSPITHVTNRQPYVEHTFDATYLYTLLRGP